MGAAGALAAPASASAHVQPQFGGPYQHNGDVYVNDNTANSNTVAGFSRNADGSLTPLPGSPFATGGAGSGAAVPSQGSLQPAFNGRLLLAVDPGSNQISVLAVDSNGVPHQLPWGTTSSNGLDPVSIAVHGDLVYVANAGPGGSNYTGFRLTLDGHLLPIPGSTISLPDSAQPGDILFNATGARLAATRVGSSQIDSFNVDLFGYLHAASGSPYQAQGAGPFGSEFSPTNPDDLYVSNAHNGAGLGTVSAFRENWFGQLSSIGSSPVADDQTAPCWVTISSDGRYLYAINTAQPSISSYQINWDGSLTLLGSTPFKDPTGLAPVDPGLSPDGHTLYVTDGGTGQISAFAVSGGSLTELASSPTALPAGAAAFGIDVS
jgi:6-phosphogluconolactonase (cycloisomerase 2 family)